MTQAGNGTRPAHHPQVHRSECTARNPPNQSQSLSRPGKPPKSQSALTIHQRCPRWLDGDGPRHAFLGDARVLEPVLRLTPPLVVTLLVITYARTTLWLMFHGTRRSWFWSGHGRFRAFRETFTHALTLRELFRSAEDLSTPISQNFTSEKGAARWIRRNTASEHLNHLITISWHRSLI